MLILPELDDLDNWRVLYCSNGTIGLSRFYDKESVLMTINMPMKEFQKRYPDYQIKEDK